jgi:hypothetical protein
MTGLLDQAVNCDDADRAAKIIQNALGIESDDVVNYRFPKSWREPYGFAGIDGFAAKFFNIALSKDVRQFFISRRADAQEMSAFFGFHAAHQWTEPAPISVPGSHALLNTLSSF